MRRNFLLRPLVSASLVVALSLAALPAAAEGMKVLSDKTATGFKLPESVAYDPTAKVLYVSEFGSELKPTQMDGMGRISKVALAEGIGRLDGIYQVKSGDLLVTDWDSGSLNLWSAKAGLQKLAADFKGPADFAVVPNDSGLLVVVPDLVKSELRLLQLGE